MVFGIALPKPKIIFRAESFIFASKMKTFWQRVDFPTQSMRVTSLLKLFVHASYSSSWTKTMALTTPSAQRLAG